LYSNGGELPVGGSYESPHHHVCVARPSQHHIPPMTHDPFQVLEYDPAIEKHPAYRPTDPEYRPGDVVRILHYDGFEFLRDEEGNQIGQRLYLTDDAAEKYSHGEVSLLTSHNVVFEEDGDSVRISTGGLTMSGSSRWIPKTRVIEFNSEGTQMLHTRLRKRKNKQQKIERRKEETDLDVLMEEVVKPHARKKVNEVWPGGTVDVDEISWFWNTRLRSCAGKAYHGNAVPQMAGDADLAIGLAPAYFYQHGRGELLAVVRHELIHCWEFNHTDINGCGHGPKFKQWIDDMDTHRHCKNWTKR